MLTRNRVDQLFSAFDDKTVIVVGDIMLDEFVWGKVRRISPEAPGPVIEVVNETYRLGGAANVGGNIRALGGNAVPIGVIGRDRAADRLAGLLRDAKIPDSGLVRDDRPTTLKTRIVAHNQQIARTDREDRTSLSAALNKA